MSDKVQSIIEEIKGLSLLEASELVKGLEETFGVSAAAATVAAAAPAARRWRSRSSCRGEDGIQRRSHCGRRQQDRRHQGRS